MPKKTVWLTIGWEVIKNVIEFKQSNKKAMDQEKQKQEKAKENRENEQSKKLKKDDTKIKQRY